MSDYTYPQSLVSTQWVAKHLGDASIRLLEAGWDTSEFESGHIPGAVAGWGYTDIVRPDTRDLPTKEHLETMLSQAGIANNHTVIVYGGLSNLVAAMAFWLLTIYGHTDVRLLDGGRQKWVAEERPLSHKKPVIQPSQYNARQPDWNLRADKSDILFWLSNPDVQILDARPVEMYTCENLAGITRGGHIPGAVNLPAERLTDAGGNFLAWRHALTQADGAFKSVEEISSLLAEKGISPDKRTITYCVRGGLSTYLWFALTQLLGYSDVREYDRSWAEWGNLQDTPIEKGVGK